MKAKVPPWWQLPSLIAGGIGLLGVLGTWAVSYATYAELPKKVEKVAEKNEQQDTAIDKLTALQEFYAQQQAPNQSYHKQPIREQDMQDIWWCCDDASYRECWDNRTWYKCP